MTDSGAESAAEKGCDADVDHLLRVTCKVARAMVGEQEQGAR